jgi:hypothetical protein
LGHRRGPSSPAASVPAAGMSSTPFGLCRSRLLWRSGCWYRFLLWSHAYIKVP